MNIINDITEFNRVAPSVKKTMSFGTIQPYIDDAEQAYIIPAISEAFFTELVDKITNNKASLSAQEKTFILKIRKAIAYYTIYDSMDFLNLPISNQGAAEISNDESIQPRQWVFNNSKKAAIKKADKALEASLVYLEKEKDNFSTWAGSEAYTIFKEFFFSTADDFSKYKNIKKSRTTFLQLKPFIALCEHKYMIPALGKTLFNGLKSRNTDNTLTADDTTLLPYIKRALAYMVIYEAIPEMILDFTNTGIVVVSTADGITSRNYSETAVNRYRSEVHSQGISFMAELKKFLDDNASTYSEYESDIAAENKTPNYEIHDNTGASSFMT